jgi:hypothetical protein
MPERLHAEHARAANETGVSLNQIITTALTDVDAGNRPEPNRPSTARSDRRLRPLSVLLAVNFVIVAAAGVIAILLLFSAWR